MSSSHTAPARRIALSGPVAKILMALIAVTAVGLATVGVIIGSVMTSAAQSGAGLAVEDVVLGVDVLVGIGLVIAVLAVVEILLLRVDRSALFQPGSVRFVTVIGGLMAALSGAVTLAVVLAALSGAPGGIVFFAGVIAALTLGITLFAFVLRSSLIKAIGRDAEAARLESELAQVI